MHYGNLIKMLRITKRVTQKVVSQKMGISQQAYSKIERSEYASTSTIRRILDSIDSNHEELEKLKRVWNSG